MGEHETLMASNASETTEVLKTIDELWQPFLDGTAQYENFRKRNDDISRLITAVGSDLLPPSLAKSFPFPVKTKPDVRTQFGVQTLDFFSEAIQLRKEFLDKRAAEDKDNLETLKKNVEAAETAIQASKEIHDRSIDALIDAQNALVNSEADAEKQAKIVSELGSREEEVKQEAAFTLNEVKEMNEVIELLAKLAEHREDPPATAAAPDVPVTVDGGKDDEKQESNADESAVGLVAV